MPARPVPSSTTVVGSGTGVNSASPLKLTPPVALIRIRIVDAYGFAAAEPLPDTVPEKAPSPNGPTVPIRPAFCVNGLLSAPAQAVAWTVEPAAPLSVPPKDNVAPWLGPTKPTWVTRTSN